MVLTIAGLVQFLLGTYIRARFERRVLEEGPIGVAFLLVSYPGISIFIGLVQMINGLWGIARARGYFTAKYVYQISLGFQWLLVLILQDVSQIAYLPAGGMAPLAPSLAAFSLGLSMMPAFLDHKMSTLPARFPPEYYSESSSSIVVGDKDVVSSTADIEIAPNTTTEDIEV